VAEMTGRTPAQPRAQQAYRVPRSRVDDVYDRAKPLPFVQVGAGEVIGVSGDGETCRVEFEAGVEVGGVVVLGATPDVGDWVEVHQRGDLLVVPEAAEETAAGEGGARVYVQPDDPGDHRIGTLWFDTDESVP
jgi:hypothetical protein